MRIRKRPVFQSAIRIPKSAIVSVFSPLHQPEAERERGDGHQAEGEQFAADVVPARERRLHGAGGVGRRQQLGEHAQGARHHLRRVIDGREQDQPRAERVGQKRAFAEAQQHVAREMLSEYSIARASLEDVYFTLTGEPFDKDETEATL